MKSAKRLIAVFAVSVAAICLAACGQQGENDEITATGSTVTYSGDAIYPIRCEDTLTYWMTLNPGVAQTVENFGDTPLGKKLEENTGIKIKYQHPAQGHADEELQRLLASDSLPDIVTNAWTNYPGGASAAVNAGYIYKHNEIFKRWAPALTKLLSEHPDWDRAVKDDNGDYYAFPFIMEEGLLQVSYGPVWRSDWLEKTGLSTPETLDEWEKALTAFRDELGAVKPMTGTWDSIIKIESAFGIWDGFYVNGGKVVYGAAEPAYKELLTTLHDWYGKGLIDAGLGDNDPADVNTNMTTGKSGVTFAWAGSGIGVYLKANGDNPDYRLAGGKYPVMTKGEIPEYSYLSYPVNMNVSVSISKNCKNPELAARFLDYGFTEEGHYLYNFGIEGESYVDIDGYPTYTDTVLNDPDGLSVTAALGRYARSAYSGPFVQDTRYIEQYYQMPQQKDAQKMWAVTNMNKHILPPVSVASAVSDRDADIMTNVNTYREEMTLKFITGEEPLESFDRYLEQLKAYGIEDSVKYRQEAYDLFMAR